MTYDEKLRAFAAAGYTADAIADELGVSKSTVQRHMREQAINTPPLRSDITAESVAKLYRRGVPTNEIADILHCSKDTVSRRLSEAGIQVDRGAMLKQAAMDKHDAIWPEIKARLDGGERPTGLSREYHIEYLNFLDMMRRNGYPWDYTGLDERLAKRKKPKKARPGMGLDEFVRRSREIHGDAYDYSQVEYVNTKTKVRIICPRHGVFEQAPEKHLAGSGCSHPDCIRARREATNLKKYGVAHPLQSADIKEKAVMTCRARYGTDNAMQDPGVREKLQDTCMERYGSSSPFGSSAIRQKIQETCISRYGSRGPMSDSVIQDRCTETCLNRYGVVNPMQDASVQERFTASMEAVHGVRNPMQIPEVKTAQRESQKETMLERYGADSGFGSVELREKARATNMLRYGTENVMHLKAFSDKMTQSKIENGTCNTSVPEDTLYAMLCDQFGQADVIRQYHSPAYPYACDFHIKSRNLYIELNASWTHGGRWYRGDADSGIVAKLLIEAEASAYYANAIHVWTESDVAKRGCAGQNALNYIVFWDTKLRDAELWFAMGCPDGRDWIQEYSWLPDSCLASPVARHVENATPMVLTRTAKAYQFSVFYARELALWQENPIYRGVSLHVFLYHNRWKYLENHKLPAELTGMDIVRGFTISGILKGYTAFDTSLMDVVVQKYGIKSVYDPCSGWGERALYCRYHDMPYLGVDINDTLFLGYDAMRQDLNMTNQAFIHADSADVRVSGQFEAVLSCPPYGGTEIYSPAGAENLSDSEFLSWWRRVVENSRQVEPEYFCFQVNRKWRDRMLDIVLDSGFDFVEEIFASQNRVSHLNRKKDGSITKKEFETMLVCIAKH